MNYFRENGYNVIMDRMVSEEISSQGPTRWGENQIRKAKKVLIFLSPGLVNLAMDSREDSQCQVLLLLMGNFNVNINILPFKPSETLGRRLILSHDSWLSKLCQKLEF